MSSSTIKCCSRFITEVWQVLFLSVLSEEFAQSAAQLHNPGNKNEHKHKWKKISVGVI